NRQSNRQNPETTSQAHQPTVLRSLHMVVLLVMAYTLLDHMSLWRWGALSLPVCVMVAAVCFWFVESPCMRAGYWLTRRRYLKPELAG
ncbi:hypothetical protein, partial [Gluconacetobacter entanii]|uniref:hypothetical protein n=1 Tax=Gluconacetobacter entanii TaxID=108528 RepID=UPI00223546C3